VPSVLHGHVARRLQSPIGQRIDWPAFAFDCQIFLAQEQSISLRGNLGRSSGRWGTLAPICAAPATTDPAVTRRNRAYAAAPPAHLRSRRTIRRWREPQHGYAHPVGRRRDTTQPRSAACACQRIE
jgi:hypothetical protein